MSGEFETTWDGLPISPEPPHGAAIVVYKEGHGRWLYLILHRAQFDPNFEGDWAWGPPAGARLPGETIDRCAERELDEETGLQLSLTRTNIGDEDWFVYMAEAPRNAQVKLSEEHDRYAWLSVDEAAAKCFPSFIGDQLRQVDQRLKLST